MKNTDNKSRRNFIYKSFLASAGIALSANFISCKSEEDFILPEEIELKNKNFDHGVASFDPTDNQVIIWTRYTTTKPSVEIAWQISSDMEFKTILRSGEESIDAKRDYTIAVEVQNLKPDQKLYYRFINTADNTKSVIGETITLPKIANEVKLAVCSCANFAAGAFTVYDAIAKSDADVVVHLGDYIYEYGDGEYGTNANTSLLKRNFQPKHEIVSLGDYRTRYQQYRKDEQLQLAHQKKPFICVWDDHEISNDAYKDGAENHNDGEGDFSQRKKDAIQAFSEYLPVRTSEAHKIYRDFKIGGLVDLIMLDTRVIGRDKQLDYANYYKSDASFDAQKFQMDLLNPKRTILGEEQRNWLIQKVNASSAKWQVLGQQVLMGKMHMPMELIGMLGAILQELKLTKTVSDATKFKFVTLLQELSTIKFRLLKSDPTLSLQEKARVQTVMPYNLDAWDGYPAEREVLFASFGNKKVISLAGDTHNAWSSKLTDLNNKEKGREFATASVTSPGLESYLNIEGGPLQQFEQAITLLTDDLEYLNSSKRGFLKLKFTASEANSEWIFVNTIASTSYNETSDKNITYTS